jgi:hypothetical protein
MATPYNMVSRDAQLALTEFSNQFDAALSASDANPWSARLGLMNVSNAIATTYPIPLDAAGYVERKGDDKMRDLYEKSLTMKTKQWVDGVKVLASKVEAPDFIGWAGAPARIAQEGARQPNVLVADMLSLNSYAGPLLDLYRSEKAGGSVASTINLFHSSHPVNVVEVAKFGTFGNITTGSAINTALVEAVKLKFRRRKAPNGKPGRWQWTVLLVPAAREEEARNFFERDLVIQAVTNVAGSENVGGVAQNNRHKGTIEIVVAPELESDDMLYAIDGTSGAYPWIVQTKGAPEEIRYDKNDAMYKDQGLIGVKYVLDMGVAAALPQGIELIDLS